MTTLPAVTPPSPPSPLDAASDALEHTRRRLFPVQVERWLVLGFLAFLDQCGRGGLSLPGGGDGGNGSGGGRGGGIGDLAVWLESHLGLIVAVAAGVLALIVALVALVLWINSRGIFMYLDAVVTGRADVRRPWREHAEAAGSLFAWRFVIAVATLLFVVLLLAAGLALLIVSARGGEPPAALVLGGLVVLLLVVLPVSVGVLLFGVALRDFVAPLQLHLRLPCGEAVRVLLLLVRAHLGTFVVYLLLKLVFSIAAAVVFLLVCCLTCCVALLPVISQTLLQPLWHFERAWPVFLLRRMGHDLFASFPGAPSTPLPAPPFTQPPRPSTAPPGEPPPAPPDASPAPRPDPA